MAAPKPKQDLLAEDLKRVITLIEWGKSKGIYLNDRVEPYCSADYGVCVRVKIDSGEQGLALEPLASGSRIVSCPFNLSLSYLNVFDSFHDLRSHSISFPTKFLATLPPKVIGVFFLIQQYLTADTSYWGEYIRSLPQPHEHEKLATPLFWSKADLKWLRGTNLEQAVPEREQAWREEWQMGQHILDNDPSLREFRGKWSFELYKWAATIFSSRSFISTLIPAEVLQEHTSSHPADPNWQKELLDNGPYPVLFPVVDLANHNPKAKIAWISSDSHDGYRDMSIVIDEEIKPGAQIFNNYAPKGNGELLLGYGFCLEDNDFFGLGLGLQNKEQLAILRKQDCYPGDQRAESKRIYHLRRQPYQRGDKDNRLEEFKYFEDGVIDVLAVLVANSREREFMLEHPEYCPERDSADSLGNEMARNTLNIISVLTQKLQHSLDQMRLGEDELGIPKNQFQRVAKIYRDGQIASLLQSLSLLNARLSANVATELSSTQVTPTPHCPLLPLSVAYAYLSTTYPTLWNALARALAEELELDIIVPKASHFDAAAFPWTELIEAEWDHALWCLWILCILSLSPNQQSAGDARLDDCLQSWAREMSIAYSAGKEEFCGAHDERESLVDIIQQAASEGDLGVGSRRLDFADPEARARVLNLASRIAGEEVLMLGLPCAGMGGLMQKVLCIPVFEQRGEVKEGCSN